MIEFALWTGGLFLALDFVASTLSAGPLDNRAAGQLVIGLAGWYACARRLVRMGRLWFAVRGAERH